MAVSIRAVPAVAVVLLASVFVIADDTAKKADAKSAAQPAAAKAEGDQAKTRAVRLTKPWKDMTSLTDDQKRQISQIHRKAVDEVKAIEQKEKSDIMALLNDQQKAEVTSLVEKDAAERKAKAAQKPAKPAASATPKDGTDAASVASGEAKAGAK